MHFLTPEQLACCQSVKFKPRCRVWSGLQAGVQRARLCVCLSVCLCVFLQAQSSEFVPMGIAGWQAEGGRVTRKCVRAGV